MLSSKVRLKRFLVGIIACVDIEHKLPCCPNPLCRHRYELEHERLYSAGGFKVESLYVKPLHDGLVKITSVRDNELYLKAL